MSIPLFAAVIFFFAIGVLVSALYLYTQIAYFLTIRLPWIIRDYLKIPDRGIQIGTLTLNLKADTSPFLTYKEKEQLALDRDVQNGTISLEDTFPLSASNQFAKPAKKKASRTK